MHGMNESQLNKVILCKNLVENDVFWIKKK